jgi:hypothetical protein
MAFVAELKFLLKIFEVQNIWSSDQSNAPPPPN